MGWKRNGFLSISGNDLVLRFCYGSVWRLWKSLPLLYVCILCPNRAIYTMFASLCSNLHILDNLFFYTIPGTKFPCITLEFAFRSSLSLLRWQHLKLRRFLTQNELRNEQGWVFLKRTDIFLICLSEKNVLPISFFKIELLLRCEHTYGNWCYIFKLCIP